MKILHLHDEVWDSGLTAYAIQIASLLKMKGHHVSMGVRSHSKPESLAQKKQIPTVRVENIFDVIEC